MNLTYVIKWEKPVGTVHTEATRDVTEAWELCDTIVTHQKIPVTLGILITAELGQFQPTPEKNEVAPVS